MTFDETQNTVGSWAQSRYPHETLKDAVIGLIEEATELAIATGAITETEAIEKLKAVWRDIGHLPKADEHIQSGIADVQICLYAIADQKEYVVQDCLDWKMTKNRERVKEDQ